MFLILNDLIFLVVVSGLDIVLLIFEYEDWDWEIVMDFYFFGRLRDIDGRLVYMFDYKYE